MSHATAGSTTEKPKMSRYIARMSRQDVASTPTLYLPKPGAFPYVHNIKNSITHRRTMGYCCGYRNVAHNFK